MVDPIFKRKKDSAMTAQIGDIYKYQNKEYSIVALSEKNPFHPKMYGMEPHPSSTACYRGYWCEYAIQDDELVLQNLFLFNKDGNYPALNGIDPAPQEFFEYEGYSGKKKVKQKFVRPKYYGHRLYRDINLHMSYTGKILLGDGFMSEYYIHMGYQRGWAYRRLIELVFEEGLLMETNDLSHLAKAQREAMKQRNVNPRYPDEGNIPQSWKIVFRWAIRKRPGGLSNEENETAGGKVMGDLYSITCRNKACRYHVLLRDGVGMIGFARLKNFEKALLEGEIKNEKALESIKAGAQIESGATYLCPECKEFVSDSTYYLVENLTYSPFGTARYDVSFPFGEPCCQKCGSKLEFIRNVLSSKVKCPRCGGELKSRVAGCFD